MEDDDSNDAIYFLLINLILDFNYYLILHQLHAVQWKLKNMIKIERFN